MYASNYDRRPAPARPWLLSILLAGLLLAGCEGDENINEPPRTLGDVTLVNSGTILLNCREYCASEVSIGPEDIIATFSGPDSLLFPPQLRRSAISAVEWNDLVGAVDLDAFMALDSIIGDVGVSSNGFEWIELEAKGARKRVTFSLGDSIPPIMPLLQKVRAIRGRIRI